MRFAADFARSQGLALVPIGQGSNIVLVNDLDAVVLRLNLQGRAITGDRLFMAAGESWHEAVSWSLSENRYGLENLALIPGTVGAAPIQNIGAYGVELADFVATVSVFDTLAGEEVTLQASDCGFAYRQSRFQSEKNLLVTGLTVELSRKPSMSLTYPGLLDRMTEEGLSPNPHHIFDTICKIRAEKLPDPVNQPNAGSFFKNPIVTREQAEGLYRRFPGLPVYPTPVDNDLVKLSAAWLIEQAGLKHSSVGAFEVSGQHALVIIHHGGGRTQDLLTLVQQVKALVQSNYGVVLEPEPGFLPAV